MASSQTIITPVGRLSFPCFFKVSDFSGKYDGAILFPKTTNLDALKALLVEAATETWGADKKNWPKKLKVPGIKNGDDESWEGYLGTNFIRVTSTRPIKVVDGRKQEVLDASEVYAGRRVVAKINAFTWKNEQGGRGISFGLALVQLGPKDDVRWGAGAEATADDLPEWEGGEDDPANYGGGFAQEASGMDDDVPF